MRTTIILHFGLLLLIGLAAKAQACTFSSKSAFSKSCPRPADTSPGDDAPVGGPQGRLARITAYWPGEDYYTTRRRSATGARLRVGYCAVDARVIPYGSIVNVFGVGTFLAMDTGSAVISRKAAREAGHNRDERSALVVDLFFPSRRAGERFCQEGPKFAMVAWQSATTVARD